MREEYRADGRSSSAGGYRTASRRSPATPPISHGRCGPSLGEPSAGLSRLHASNPNVYLNKGFMPNPAAVLDLFCQFDQSCQFHSFCQFAPF
ncbi:hypothetical protein CA85_34510 [Allorhodopirellula solitaria]|uniref:Uncharacterized protein n=1 Tax=Allorhodopirellula solitaria TaxID=2527987 RepID=A0A5C5XQD2_9BACT|nr:hypothetical protein CA85_34510 [Allorhodopirellula solitaria]